MFHFFSNSTPAGLLIPLSRDKVCQNEADGRCQGDLDSLLCEDMGGSCRRKGDEDIGHSHFKHIHKHQICDGVPDCEGYIYCDFQYKRKS